MVLQKIAENDEAARTAMKAFVFGDAVNIGRKLPGHDPYQPAGIDKWDPNAKLPAGAPLKMLMMKMLTATSFNAKHLAGNLFALCDDDAEEFAHLCGLGSAAGLLASGVYSRDCSSKQMRPSMLQIEKLRHHRLLQLQGRRLQSTHRDR